MTVHPARWEVKSYRYPSSTALPPSLISLMGLVSLSLPLMTSLFLLAPVCIFLISYSSFSLAYTSADSYRSARIPRGLVFLPQAPSSLGPTAHCHVSLDFPDQIPDSQERQLDSPSSSLPSSYALSATVQPQPGAFWITCPSLIQPEWRGLPLRTPAGLSIGVCARAVSFRKEPGRPGFPGFRLTLASDQNVLLCDSFPLALIIPSRATRRSLRPLAHGRSSDT